MLDDRTFLTSVGALEAVADRLGQQTVTIQTDHLRRLLEMAERAGPPSPDAETPHRRMTCAGLVGGYQCSMARPTTPATRRFRDPSRGRSGWHQPRKRASRSGR